MQLVKNRRRDPLAIGYGKFMILDDNEVVIAGRNWALTLDDVETFVSPPTKKKT